MPMDACYITIFIFLLHFSGLDIFFLSLDAFQNITILDAVIIL